MFIRNLNQNPSRLAILMLAGLSSILQTEAAVLNPAATITLRSAHEPEDGHLLVSTNFTFASATFAGQLTSKVWANDESNPFGGLTFVYRLTNTGDCTDSLGWFDLSGFAGSLVDVNYSGSGVAPRSATRSSSGAKITFGFFDRDGDETLLASDTSAWLVIQTDRTTWGLSQLVGMDSEQVAVTTFAPVAVPEPTVAAVMALAGALMATRRAKV